MVFTALHYLAIAPLQFKMRDKIDPIALVLSTTLIDIEPLVGFFTGNYHWVLHSFFGAGVFSVFIAFAVFALERGDSFVISFVYRALGLEKREHKLRFVLLTSVLGGTSHVLLDAFTHRSFPYVLFPFRASANPFWMGFGVGHLVQAVAILLSLYSVYLWSKNVLG